MDLSFKIIPVADHFWALDQGGVRSYLLEGCDKAMLIDTCFGGELFSSCRQVTDKPIILISTHSDGDHIGGDEQFDIQYIHPAEMDAYERRNGRACKALPLWEGEQFDIGNYCLEVVLIPGHTPGSIALLERSKHFLISGDTVSYDGVYLFGDGRNLKALRFSYEKLEKLRSSGAFDTVYPSHGEFPIPADVIPEALELCDLLLTGKAVPDGPAPVFGSEAVFTYTNKRAKFYFA